MWFIGVEVEQETSAPSPEKNPGSAPETGQNTSTNLSIRTSLLAMIVVRAFPLVNS